jgi:2-polyprenyl-3-methyl-5-hydroxy-6-metoxy-1,4-benzoquinol methylase
MQKSEIRSRIESVARAFPANMVQQQLDDVSRIVFHVQLAIEGLENDLPSKTIVDVGGGIGLFSLACKAVGFGKVRLVDDFRDQVNRENPDALKLHEKHGIEVYSRDASSESIRDILEGCNRVTSFDSIEHWHRSPKATLRDSMEGLLPGGKLILAVPNCVNLRKRIAILLGRGKWSRMQDWYESDVFRGHVREPDVEDLHYIAKDIGLQPYSILGRNWLGYSGNSVRRMLAAVADYPLRLRPRLCSDIYLVGTKPKKTTS